MRVITPVNHQKKSQGLAALEFIICLPVLLMLSVLILDVGRVLIQYTELNKALQNGVRYAVVDTYGTLDFTAIADEGSIKNVVIYGNPQVNDSSEPMIDYISADDIVITQPTPISKEVTLSASFVYEPFFSELPFSDVSLAFNVAASSKMRTAP